MSEKTDKGNVVDNVVDIYDYRLRKASDNLENNNGDYDYDETVDRLFRGGIDTSGMSLTEKAILDAGIYTNMSAEALAHKIRESAKDKGGHVDADGGDKKKIQAGIGERSKKFRNTALAIAMTAILLFAIYQGETSKRQIPLADQKPKTTANNEALNEELTNPENEHINGVEQIIIKNENGRRIRTGHSVPNEKYELINRVGYLPPETVIELPAGTGVLKYEEDNPYKDHPSAFESIMKRSCAWYGIPSEDIPDKFFRQGPLSNNKPDENQYVWINGLDVELVKPDPEKVADQDIDSQ
ncbi:MAG: hypothetical protein LBC95_00770 [Candidatus Nomurabacteria bacterium]|jgi:hypothetical protein|nr:hypothetical protein [Candidatus Nomurabacteria bacterium]